MASPWLVAADSLFVSGLTPPCRCIGTCSVVSHAGLTGRGLAGGERGAGAVGGVDEHADDARRALYMVPFMCADRHV